MSSICESLAFHDTYITHPYKITHTHTNTHVCLSHRMFSVGISTAFGLVNRLDRLMVAVKEVVGEHYYIYGVGLLSSAYAPLGVGDTGSVHTNGRGFYGGAYPDSLRTIDRNRDRDRDKEKRALEVRFNG
jgi:Aromatic acid exporter family member 2